MGKKKILIVVASYYIEVSEFLLQGAKNHFKTIDNFYEISIKKVPGCFEIPFTINKENKYDGYVALGCIIRGETYHFELISNEVTRKVMDLSVNLKKPIGYGILTCENLEQALVRSNPSKGNKGAEAAEACSQLLRYTSS